MSKSTCAKCKRFISRKRPCAFCDADNDLRLSDDCDLVIEAVTLLDRFEPILETFNARMMKFDGVAMMDGLSADLAAMDTRQVILEECLAKLEVEVRADPASSADGSHALPNDC
ncbi:hypothetical protein ALC56_01426 [Trachymyrmex septentrionalis]|uniref:Uncharacterized protein n=1 Tax=Trachymyrmex septentrionalis TaxID=34720 RepID=A0A195FU13_9HYME|nr:hypothetical protein ALC56_01426 [Trachymyrmex septentrionalis]